MLLALMCALLMGTAWMLDKPASRGLPASIYSFAVWTLPLIFIAFPKIPLTALKKEMRIGSWHVVLMAFLNVFGYIIQIKALSLGDASRVIPITSSASILTVLGGIFILKEKTSIGRKIFAGILGFVGVILLT
ncbi:TPA: hypothetical protein DIS61_04985 [Patescibacteria group bacterium]|nr:hypothetical protein [Patescibacteria group bacterium]